MLLQNYIWNCFFVLLFFFLVEWRGSGGDGESEARRDVWVMEDLVLFVVFSLPRTLRTASVCSITSDLSRGLGGEKAIFPFPMSEKEKQFRHYSAT